MTIYTSIPPHTPSDTSPHTSPHLPTDTSPPHSLPRWSQQASTLSLYKVSRGQALSFKPLGSRRFRRYPKVGNGRKIVTPRGWPKLYMTEWYWLKGTSHMTKESIGEWYWLFMLPIWGLNTPYWAALSVFKLLLLSQFSHLISSLRHVRVM